MGRPQKPVALPEALFGWSACAPRHARCRLRRRCTKRRCGPYRDDHDGVHQPRRSVRNVTQRLAVGPRCQFAQCMRAHGVPGFPDPGVSPGGGKLPGPGYFVQAQSGPLSPDNPQFVKAQKSCQTLTGGLY